MPAIPCPDCGAVYVLGTDSCEARFAVLLGLDHSRQEPWGSRHGQAFAAFALQHPRRYATSLDQAWVALYQIYAVRVEPRYVFATLRAAANGALPAAWKIPPRASVRLRAPGITIADLDDFDAETYAGRLDQWCRATLVSWGVSLARGSA